MKPFWQRSIFRVLLVLGFATSGLTLSFNVSADASRGELLFTTSSIPDGYGCVSCHSGPPTASGYQNLRFNQSWATSTSALEARLRTLPGSDTMSALGTAAAAKPSQDATDVADIYAFLIAKRDDLNPIAKIDSPATNTSFQVGSPRLISGTTSKPLNEVTGVTYQWAVEGSPCVTTQLGTAATQSVTLTEVGTCRVTLTVRTSAGATSSDFIDIRVTAIPVPVFLPSGFDALTNFSARPSGSDTMCPTIQNTGTADLTLSFSAVRAADSSADYSNYFELGDNASCLSTQPACDTSIPAGSPIAGSTTLLPKSTCTLALRFNPSKFSDAASNIAARSATLQVMHNAPNGSVAEFPMTGNLKFALLTASTASLSLGSVRVGSRSAPVELRLTSAGGDEVRVTGMEAGAPFTVQSKTCPSLPFTLLSGGDCTMTVTFTPTDARAASAILRISTDTDSKALEISLAGTGEESADLSGGGCSIASGDTLADPTLWSLVLLAIAALAYRRRTRTTLRNRP
jgi:Abnormal spindle-like microcephaly-assoc'd, ASPM-SPD-2-Hydin